VEPTKESGEPAVTLKLEMTPTLPEQSPQEAPGIFNIFIDGFGKGIALTSIEDIPSLHIVDVEGGSIGLWNNRPHTKKVHVGDLVVKVRKAGPNQEAWIDSDTSLMLSLLESSGPFEVQLKHTEPQGQQQPSPILEPRLEAPAKAIARMHRLTLSKVTLACLKLRTKLMEAVVGSGRAACSSKRERCDAPLRVLFCFNGCFNVSGHNWLGSEPRYANFLKTRILCRSVRMPTAPLD